MSQPSSSLGKDYDMHELDQDIFKYLDGHDQSAFQENRHQTLNMFPSQPMHSVVPSAQAGEALANGSTSRSPITQSMGVNPAQRKSSDHAPPVSADQGNDYRPIVKREGSRKATTSSSEQDAPKTPDPKTLRRLAQNREAARKSRLRKKAYIQQLETSRLRLSQLEQDLQIARAQGAILGGSALPNDQGLPTVSGALTPEAAMFDMDYVRWMDDHHKLMCQLRAALEEHLPENQLQLLVDSALSHHEMLINIKGALARSDVFHLTTGTWMSPAERCFLWIGGCRPGELIKVVLRHVEPLTEQQIVAICNLQQSVQESEDALNHGLDAVYRSLSETVTSDVLTSSTIDVASFVGSLSVAMSKLSSVEAFVRQADSLRIQTLHRLHQILTVRQAARCFLAITEYFHRLRALSSLWISRPRQGGEFRN
ncbi:BZIP transcription factor family protein [Rhynchospora pubera]|uniref:BZIP transcription factor family protein n=1 Tax=Rhynchospora pubera TaxID=906938 RepID=A0AAV8HDL0_9POAL|nr:BZIP transcription factor family protein [Rhynchospora pubera]